MQITKSLLRNQAIAHTLFKPTSLANAIQTLGFVQADPIRSPARAQDLILRHRVENYHVHELENRYRELEIEEDFLYAYGFLTRSLQKHLHPRAVTIIGSLEESILTSFSSSQTPLDIKELGQLFGTGRMVNGWGGYSQAITLALDNLHMAGLLRIHGREKGRRLYIPTAAPIPTGTLDERLSEIILAVVQILSPVTERTLHGSLVRTRQQIGETKPIIEKLIQSGKLERQKIDQLVYLWPAGSMKKTTTSTSDRVLFLAPFDPLVWDRRRFEHLWGWPYRFEAYTPIAKRIRGYYAMPMLWRDQIIGWSNITVRNGQMEIIHGYVDTPPRDSAFKNALDAETRRMQLFLQLPDS